MVDDLPLFRMQCGARGPVPIAKVQKWLGQANVSTMRHYETGVWSSVTFANREIAEFKPAKRAKDPIGYERTVRARSSISGRMPFKS